jgi:hypothetical protein
MRLKMPLQIIPPWKAPSPLPSILAPFNCTKVPLCCFMDAVDMSIDVFGGFEAALAKRAAARAGVGFEMAAG